jgi:hypothetical protein
MLLAIVLALRTPYAQSYPSATLATLWMLMSAALVSYGRAHAGIAFALTARYRIYSDLFLVYCYGFCISWLAKSSLSTPQRRLVQGAVVGAALFICAVNDFHAITILREHRQQLFIGLAQYQTSGHQASPMYFSDKTTDQMFSRQKIEARSLIEEAAKQGLYSPPAIPSSEIQSASPFAISSLRMRNR